jgi:hypothetical protein
MEIEYYNKYLKYKQKYINLIQYGTAISKNKKKNLKDIFPKKLLEDDNVYIVHLSENPNIFLYNKKNIIHFLAKKIQEIEQIKNNIKEDNKKIYLLEKIDIQYKTNIDKHSSLNDIKNILEDLTKKVDNINIFKEKIDELIINKSQNNPNLSKQYNTLLDLFNICDEIEYIKPQNINYSDMNLNRTDIIELIKLLNNNLLSYKVNDKYSSYYDNKYSDNPYRTFPKEYDITFNDVFVAKPGTFKTNRIYISGKLVGFYINDEDSIILLKKDNKE